MQLLFSHEDMIDHRRYTHNLSNCVKPEKNPGLNGIQTHDLCDAVGVLYQLSYQAIWDMSWSLCKFSHVRNSTKTLKQASLTSDRILFSPHHCTTDFSSWYMRKKGADQLKKKTTNID